MADLRALKDKAAQLAAKGKVEKAVDAYRSVLKADPRDTATRQRLAEVLRRAEQVADAVEEYTRVAEQYARQGLLAKAIAICKTILELDPDHVTTQTTLAELYSTRARTDRPARLTAMTTPAVLVPGRAGEGPTLVPVAPAAAEEVHAAQEASELVELPLTPARRPALVPPPPVPAPPAEEPAPAPRRAPTGPALSAAETPLAQILSVAQAAAAAGVDEDVVLDLDDEPLEIIEAPHFHPAARAEPRTADETAEVLEEAELVGDEPLEAAAAGEEEAAELVPEEEVLEASPEAAAPAPRRGMAVPADLALPRVPLFSDLSREAFIALTEGMVLQRLRAGETVIQEGEAGTSFYVVAGGTLAVTKRDDRGERVRLARLGEGDFFGEMAILSGAARLATVTAETDAELLEIRAEVLVDLAGRHPHVAVSLRRFYRQRLLANAMAVSPVFRPLSREGRREIMGRFRTRDVTAGEVIIREGEPSDGLYVVLDGAFQVRHRRGVEGVEVAELREADVFGEMSCLRKIPATATVTARRAGTLLRLPRAGFDELVLSNPQILEVVAEISEERAESLDAILSGHAQWTEEGLVLI